MVWRTPFWTPLGYRSGGRSLIPNHLDCYFLWTFWRSDMTHYEGTGTPLGPWEPGYWRVHTPPSSGDTSLLREGDPYGIPE